MKALEELLSSVDILPGVGGRNSVLPFKVTGVFETIEVETPSGSVNQQALAKGTMFGFKVPTWMEGISGPSIHCHFISENDESAVRIGGRVKAFEAGKDAVIGVGKCGRFHLGFPQGEDWEGVSLT